MVMSFAESSGTLRRVVSAYGPKRLRLSSYTVEARKLEHHYPHALKVKYKGS